MLFVSSKSSSAHIVIFLEKKVAVTHIIQNYFFHKKNWKKKRQKVTSAHINLLFKKLRPQHILYSIYKNCVLNTYYIVDAEHFVIEAIKPKKKDKDANNKKKKEFKYMVKKLEFTHHRNKYQT